MRAVEGVRFHGRHDLRHGLQRVRGARELGGPRPARVLDRPDEHIQQRPRRVDAVFVAGDEAG